MTVCARCGVTLGRAAARLCAACRATPALLEVAPMRPPLVLELVDATPPPREAASLRLPFPP